MINTKKMKKFGAKVLSAVLVAGLLGGILPDFGHLENSKAEAADAPRHYATTTFRKVVDNISELPQYVDYMAYSGGVSDPNYIKARDENISKEWGRKDRPFTILELVDYEENAEIGYLIGGCEPIPVEDMMSNSNSTLYALKSQNYVTLYNDWRVQFFEDEKEADPNYYSKTSWADGDKIKGGASAVTLKGYYEYVGAGNGLFEVFYDEASATCVIDKSASGTLMWHTVNDVVASRPEFVSADYTTELTENTLKKLGDRYFTTRTSDDDNVVIKVGSNYMLAENNEAFLISVMELDEKEASEYSVAVKTITAEELNTQPEWVEYADLIMISYRGGSAGTAASWWKGQNRLGHTSVVPEGGSQEKNYFLSHDLDWDVCMKIFNKVTAVKNHAALIYDNNIYDNAFDQSVAEVQMYDSNLNPTGWIQKNVSATSNNVLKMCLITAAINPNLVKKVYSDYITVEYDSVAKKNIPVLSLQKGDAQKYWTKYTFMMLPPGADLINGSNSHLESMLMSKEYWNSFEGTNIYTQESYKKFASGRIYAFKGDNSMASDFSSSKLGINHEFFADFDQYMKDHYNNPSLKAEDGTSADAIRYALGIGRRTTVFDDKLHVLDIEPSVAIDANHNPIWTFKESSVYFMLPSFSGDVEITHMTTAQFNGKSMDMNSDYDMVYIGADIGGFNTDSNGKTRFNESALCGKIYFHTGDYAMSYKNKGQSVAFTANAGASTNEKLRYSGNDISRLKKAELVSFLNGKHPVVVDDKLYDLSTLGDYIADSDANCQIANLLKTTAYRDKTMFGTNNTAGLQDLVMNGRAGVSFEVLPAEYKATSSVITNVNIGGKNYAEIGNTAGYLTNKLSFSFTTPRDGFKFKILIDKNRDGKFIESDGELIVEKDARVGVNTYSYSLSSSLVGFIQWKIIVYDTNRPGVESVRTGCSAVTMKNSSEKKVIKVLQVMPKKDNNLNLETNGTFIKYYGNLKEFDVIVHSIGWDTFEQVFKDLKTRKRTFTYNIGKGVKEGEDETDPNPKTDLLEELSKIKFKLSNGSDSPYSVLDYNMMVIGFADTYGDTDISNVYGVAEYLNYFGSREDKSILYTHDNTSLYNDVNTNGTGVKFGATANAMLRDQMGMNRYKMVSKFLAYLRPNAEAAVKNNLKSEMEAYQATQTYDTMFAYTPEYQGYTFFAIHKLCSYGAGADKNIIQPLKYTITDPSDNSPVCDTGNYGNYDYATKTGFADTNYATTRAAMLNKGQITTYPYYINPEFTVASTHPQWYQLNIEDPNVTVWYCLKDNKASGGYKNDNPAIGIAASPMDASNDYYIYSKGNIFYSGVGHSTITGDEEAKLFVNTMIAAYRQDVSAPYADVVNDDVVQNDDHEFTLQVLRENNSVSDLESFSAGETVRVEFVVLDGNFSNNLSCKISFPGMPASLVVKKGDGTVLSKDADGYYTGIRHDEMCYFDFPKSLLNTGAKDVTFEARNNIRKTNIGTSTLHIVAQPMFFLD